MISIFNSKSKKRKTSEVPENEMFGTELSFAAKEAYKLLRTNLAFALADIEEGRGYIVGVTSSLRGEGKSTTTLNLASVLAEQGKHVIVVEGDLRLPSLRKKLKMKGKVGLTNVLLSAGDPLEYIQVCKAGVVEDREICFDLLLAGEIPPNPSELLGSKRMEEILKKLTESYEYVLMDLPPVTAVSDALVATKLVDGVVMVVRNEYADSSSLNEAIRQLRQVDGKILGFVFTCANSTLGGYRKKYKYGYKYKKYGYRYYYNYSENK